MYYSFIKLNIFKVSASWNIRHYIQKWQYIYFFKIICIYTRSSCKWRLIYLILKPSSQLFSDHHFIFMFSFFLRSQFLLKIVINEKLYNYFFLTRPALNLFSIFSLYIIWKSFFRVMKSKVSNQSSEQLCK